MPHKAICAEEHIVLSKTELRSSRDSSSNSRKSDKPSTLVVGATGRTGLACIRRFARFDKGKPEVHAFCRDASHLSKSDKLHCESVIEGDATDANDLKRALKQSKANTVLVCIGDRCCLQAPEVRTASAKALAEVMSKRKFRHVRAIVISRVGAGDSSQSLGNGVVGKIMTHQLRHVIKDHTGQEEALAELSERVTIVRPTIVKDKNGTGSVQQFRDIDKWPSMDLPRDDLASWIVHEVFSGFPLGGRTANICGAPGAGGKKT